MNRYERYLEAKEAEDARRRAMDQALFLARKAERQAAEFAARVDAEKDPNYANYELGIFGRNFINPLPFAMNWKGTGMEKW